MIAVEVANRSGVEVEEEAAVALSRRVLGGEGIGEGELGLHFVGPEEMRALKAAHLDKDEVTDVLSFPLDGRERLEPGPPRQLGDAVICPQVVGEAWRRPLVHGLLHLVGYDHGAEMQAREARWTG
jgi:rRNA maturation RNase YbeY